MAVLSEENALWRANAIPYDLCHVGRVAAVAPVPLAGRAPASAADERRESEVSRWLSLFEAPKDRNEEGRSSATLRTRRGGHPPGHPK
ncbi:hypothetical protein [Streptomyces sp. NBC_00842]|uniref:hypothetical protein n=1 Tax=Streptomyces sp. NBC_00842 TaxID=2975848 RepID=UPI00386AA274|nr:hypothetical protein OH821_33190 [Streptomyces sp. NBC_00842]